MNDKKPLRIIHCVRSPIGGIFRHVIDLAVAQSAAGHKVGIICDSATGGAFEAEKIADVAPRLAFGVQRVPMNRRIATSDVRLTFSLMGKLMPMQPDVLHGHGAKGGAYARVIGTLFRIAGYKVARIYCPHGGSLHFDADCREGRTYFRLERLLGRITDGIVFVSDYEAGAYGGKVGRAPCLTSRVNNGLRPEEFEPILPQPGMADLMFAGMMRDLKGPHVLVEALAVLERDYGRRPTVRFMGAGDDRPRYEQRVDELGLADRVTFRDPLPTREALSQGRILVVPSLAESMPYLVLEAAAAGIPMVGTNVGGMPEIFGERSDRLIPAGDPAALAAAIAVMLEHEDGARLDAAEFRTDLGTRFSLALMANSVEALYREILTPPRAAGAGETGIAGHVSGTTELAHR